ncbi:hypothetical protein ABLE68_22145 [Nocardioides sp. CN2-186]|uniref:hypothetical protein n=1 Tax=Nocardioides tweenelious TaxID=3156607 RepID=UPI0032B48DBC
MSTHVHPHVHENPHAGQGSVLLDIGGDIGALVVMTPEWMLGHEVEIAPADEEFDRAHRPHVAVVPRPVAGGEVPSLVFGELTAGRYRLAEKGTTDVRLEVEVRGGEVTSADWPTS